MRLFFRTAVLLSVLLLLAASDSLQAQQQQQRIRPSLGASVSQTLGVDTKITITYSRPGVKGRKIWGELVPYGMAPGNNYSNGKPFPWRAGANEATTIEFSKNVLVEGKPLAAGKYSLHMIPGESQWTIIFNRKAQGMGSYDYDPTQDALRVVVTPVAAPFQEWLVYGFDDLAGVSATAFLHWEKLKVPFKIQTAEPAPTQAAPATTAPPAPKPRGSVVNPKP